MDLNNNITNFDLNESLGALSIQATQSANERNEINDDIRYDYNENQVDDNYYDNPEGKIKL